MYIANIKLYKVEHSYKNTIYYLYNNLIHAFHMLNFIFHKLSMQLIINLLLTFNRSIKPTIRFLTKISKLSL